MNHKELLRLIRRVAREEANEVVEEHLTDYEHTEKTMSVEELEAEK